MCNARAGLGKFGPDAFGVARWAIYARPDLPIHRPEDLADVPIAVGMRAGSHFNVPNRLENLLPLDRIKTVNIGGFGARLSALLEREVDAASLLDPHISMADQLGVRRVIANRAKDDNYFRVLQRADADLERDPASCLPLWRFSIPAEFQDQAWDFRCFDVGERFFYAALGRDEFDELLQAAREVAIPCCVFCTRSGSQPTSSCGRTWSRRPGRGIRRTSPATGTSTSMARW